MEKQPLKIYTLDEIQDQHLGKIGTPKRDEYEAKIRVDVLGKLLKAARQEQNLTQQQLGELVGVQKSRISKIENNASNVALSTILKIFEVLKTNVSLVVKGKTIELV